MHIPVPTRIEMSYGAHELTCSPRNILLSPSIILMMCINLTCCKKKYVYSQHRYYNIDWLYLPNLASYHSFRTCFSSKTSRAEMASSWVKDTCFIPGNFVPGNFVPGRVPPREHLYLYLLFCCAELEYPTDANSHNFLLSGSSSQLQLLLAHSPSPALPLFFNFFKLHIGCIWE